VAANWRISVDRAWRSELFRRKFESECGFHPLADSPMERTKEAIEGYTATYEDNFLLWATKQLGLETQAPEQIRRKLKPEAEHSGSSR
jgi:hypothetical protein